MDRYEVQSREDDWAGHDGMAWVFKADEARIQAVPFFPSGWDRLLEENELATLRITWPRAPERVRAARAPAFLDTGGGELLFIGGWHRWSSPLTGYGWRVHKDWVVHNLLRAQVMPPPLAGDPAAVQRRVEAQLRGEERERRSAEGRGHWEQRESQRGRLNDREGVRLRQRNLRAERLITAGGCPWPDEDCTGAAIWAQVLSPLRGEPEALKAVWAVAVRLSGGTTPTAGALRRARQEYGRARRIAPLGLPY